MIGRLLRPDLRGVEEAGSGSRHVESFSGLALWKL
jgi:hypothetical protein